MSQKSNSIFGHRHGAVISELRVIANKMSSTLTCVPMMLRLYVSFAKEPYKRDYILQKRPIILRSLLVCAHEAHLWMLIVLLLHLL